MQIRQKTTIGLAAALVLAGGTTAGMAVAANATQTAQTPSTGEAPQRASAAVATAAQKPAAQPAAPAPGSSPVSQVSQDQAVQTALAQSPGAVLESAKLDAKDNYWEIDLGPGAGQTQHLDYKIDAATGAVRSVETDSSHAAPAPAPGAASHDGHSPTQEAHEGHTPAQEQAHQVKEQNEQAKDQAEKAREKSSGKHADGKDD